jgi:hypothetical protein
MLKRQIRGGRNCAPGVMTWYKNVTDQRLSSGMIGHDSSIIFLLWKAESLLLRECKGHRANDQEMSGLPILIVLVSRSGFSWMQ